MTKKRFIAALIAIAVTGGGIFLLAAPGQASKRSTVTVDLTEPGESVAYATFVDGKAYAYHVKIKREAEVERGTGKVLEEYVTEVSSDIASLPQPTPLAPGQTPPEPSREERSKAYAMVGLDENGETHDIPAMLREKNKDKTARREAKIKAAARP